MKRRDFLGAVSAPILVGAFGAARAQNSQPLHIVIPYAAGGQTDILMRLLGESIGQTLARPIVIDNKPGAAALIATRYVMNAAPDGNTILSHNSGYVALPYLQKAATYDPVKALDAIAMFGVSPNLLMVTAGVPAQTMPEFLAWAKTQTQGIECANSGIGSGGHISALLFAKMANINLIHIPFKGSAEVATALISGEVKMQISVTTDSLNPYIKAGKVRILGAATKERTRMVPNVPAISEYLPGYAIDGWFGILAPPNTPLAIRETIAKAIEKAMEPPATRERFLALYMDPTFKGPTAFAQEVAVSQANFKRIIADELGLQPS
jgi:tripartite-type tricarboxylate transporter receptor subunit TctC